MLWERILLRRVSSILKRSERESTYDVGAGGDDGGVQRLEADGAVFLGIDGELEHALEGGFVFGAEVDDFLPLEGGEEGGYALAAEFPYTNWVSLALLGLANESWRKD